MINTNQMLIDVLNVPEYAQDYPYLVTTLIDNELWFYGAYPTKEKGLTVQQILLQRNPQHPILIVENPNFTTKQ